MTFVERPKTLLFLLTKYTKIRSLTSSEFKQKLVMHHIHHISIALPHPSHTQKHHLQLRIFQSKSKWLIKW